MSRLLVTITRCDGDDTSSREVNVPEFVQARDVVDATVANIKEIWGESEIDEILRTHSERLP